MRMPKVLTNHAGRHPHRTEQQKITLFLLLHHQPQRFRLTSWPSILNQQDQTLKTAVRKLQRQCLGATQQHPKPLASLLIAAPVSQQPTRGRSHQWEDYCHQASLKQRHCEAFKRLRSPILCSSSEPSREDLNPVMKKNLDEQHRRLEELIQRLNNQPEVDRNMGSRVISKRDELEMLSVTSSIYGHLNF